MSLNVTMPKWGLTMKEGTISKWFKKEGDAVEKGEDLFEVETEKITNIVAASDSGILFQIVVAERAKVAVGTIVAVIAQPGEQPDPIEGLQVGKLIEAESTPAKPSDAIPAETKEAKFVPASPAARRQAKELGLEISAVIGTGPAGRVTEADVKKFHEESLLFPKITPLAAEMARQAGLDLNTITGSGDEGKIIKEDVERALEASVSEEKTTSQKSIPLQGMRKLIADNMHISLHSSAQLTHITEVDVTEMVHSRDVIREEYKNDENVRISFNDIIVLVTSRVLKRFPIMNSTLIEEEIFLHNSVNMGIAVALEDGLIVPVLRDADKKGLLQIASEIRDLARKAREGTLDMDDVTGGTFTITNLSMFRVDGFTPILRPPETGILGVGRVLEKPAIHNGEVSIRSMMHLSLTFDHQVADGAPAADFLTTLSRYLEKPDLIMS